jgi:glycosyltransferase involved in cell wall biosynthesis
MRVGVVSKWFNRGQPVVGRQTRSALEELGHETFVLARPKKERGPRPGALDRDDVWDQPGVTEASAYDIPAAEYERWVSENGIEAIFCDQNYQFAELAALRAAGVRTIGRFVWEHFTADHVAGAREAYDVVFSLTRAEQSRYAEMGIESPYVRWGCHPELLEVAREVRASADPAAPGRIPAEPGSPVADAPWEEAGGTVVYVFPGGFLGHRKPVEPVLEAFMAAADPRVRLLVKAQVERAHVRPAAEAAERDPRIRVEVGDQPTRAHLREVAACDVCVSPARWEGLGLPLYEAIAFGMPSITNDAPPMNEAVSDGVNGLLVASHPNGTAKSGIPALDPDIGALTAAIERLADDGERARLAAGARAVRDTERRWEHTVRGFGELLDRVA